MTAKAPSSVMRRATIFVQDLDRAITFYREVLGLEPWFERPPGALPEGFPVGEPGRTGGMRFVIVRGWDPQIGMLGLIEITEPPLSARADHRLRQGNIALVFETNDIERALAALVRLGGTVLRPLREGTNFGDLRANRIAARVVLAADPDGQYLEIFQRL